MTTANGEPRDKALGSTSYELFILVISILSIVNMCMLPFLDGSAAQVVAITDLTLTVFFTADFVKRLTGSHPRSHYLLRDWGWADLLAIIPFLRIFRLFRLVRVIRKLRRYGGEVFVADLRTNRSTSAFGLTVALVLIVVEVSGALIVSVESPSPEANIQTGIDAVWWAYVTITTVGYGDRYPVTTEGRILGVLLLVAGIALFSVLTGYVAQKLIGSPAGSSAPEAEDGAGATGDGDVPAAAGAGDASLLDPLDPVDEIAALVRLADETGERHAELRRRIAALEHRIANR
jgi:voltage-gated potassium channel